MRRTKIVATLGPATDDPAVLQALVAAGLDVARLNLSHGRTEDRVRRVQELRAVERSAGRPIGLLFDTRGPEVRLGAFAGGSADIVLGQDFWLRADGRLGDAEQASVSFGGLFSVLRAGMTVLLDDGRVPLEVVEVFRDHARCRAGADATLTDNRKVTVRGASLPLPPLTEEDLADLRLGTELGMDFVAASFTSTAAHVLEVRDALANLGSDARVIAKLETPEGMDNLDAILRVADGIMVARGDLGVECAPEDVPLMQKRAIHAANRFGKPVITATQMLETMISQPVATRAEASDVANAILDGSDAVMLSGETATGRYPVQAVRFMARLCERVEESFPYGRRPPGERTPDTVPEAISAATVEIAQQLGARAIITATQSGYTTRMVARHRPRAQIVAATPDERAARATLLVWGAQPLLVQPGDSGDQVAAQAIEAARRNGLVGEGDVLVYTAGVPVGVPGTTNLIRVHTVGNVALHGHGIGDGRASGPVVRVARASDIARIGKGAVVVAHHTDASMVAALANAVALVVEEGGLTSHAAIVGLSLGVPVIVGASGALGILREGESVTVDAARSLVYQGIVPVS
ncbi:MAG: pyruvate kinase [Thermaerobacter sp.]|nr:pyruvate kinase [Thermaerobacter sp.]